MYDMLILVLLVGGINIEWTS